MSTQIQGKDTSKDVVLRETTPYNSEPKPYLLTEFITPTKFFFVRNHGNIPEIKEGDFRLSVSVDLKIMGQRVQKKSTFTMNDLKTKFPKNTITVSLTGAGLRKTEFSKYKKISGEPPKKKQKNTQVEFGEGATGCATWGGLKLRDLLIASGVEQNMVNKMMEQQNEGWVGFEGTDQIVKNEKIINFGGSIELCKAMQPECLLAYEMNGQKLLPVHGFPLRAIIPGYIGGRNVKWLSNITVQMQPSENYFQQLDFKLFSPQKGPDEVDLKKGISLGELPVNSAITRPTEGESIKSGEELVVTGYAITGGNRKVERVDVTLDEGKTWIEAEIIEGEKQKYGWKLWRVRIPVSKEMAGKKLKISAKAVDSSANTQPSEIGHVWNWMGYVNNSWHTITVNVQ